MSTRVKINDDLQQAAQAQGSHPLKAEHEPTHTVYFLYSEDMHQQASIAMQEQNDLAAIQAGIDDMEAGRVTPVAEADALLRERLGFPPKKR